MLDKTQQPTASRRRATGQQAHGRKRGRTWPLPAVLAVLIAVLALAAPASAAGPVTGLLNTVAKAATPAVTQAVPAAAPVDPSPAAAQQAGDVAPAPAPVVPTPSAHTGTSVSAAGSELPTATSHHDQTAGGAPAHQPESAPRPAEGPHGSGSTPPRAAGSADSAGAGATSAASPQRPSEPGDRVALMAKQVTDSTAHTAGVVLPADRGERKPLPSRLLGAATAATPGHPAQHLALAPALLGASHAIGDVGETATRLVGTTPATIASSLTPLTRAVPLPTLPELATLPELPSLLTLPVLPALPMLPTLPGLPTLPEFAELPELLSLPVLTSVLPTLPAPAEPIALSSPAGPARGGDVGPSTATAQQGAWQASSVEEAYAASANGVRGAMGAPDLPGSTSSAATTPEAWAPGSTASAYGLSASAGSAQGTRGATSPWGAYQQPSPAPSPGGISAATGAVAGTSIPIFLTLAGLLLLATPRVRRVLRLLGESWRLSPLALIPERPG